MFSQRTHKFTTNGAHPVQGGSGDLDAKGGVDGAEPGADYPRASGRAFSSGIVLSLFSEAGAAPAVDTFVAPGGADAEYDKFVASNVNFAAAIGGALPVLLSLSLSFLRCATAANVWQPL